MVASSSSDEPSGLAPDEYAYKGYLTLQFHDSEQQSTVFCWLHRSGTLTWMNQANAIQVLECQLAFIDDKDFFHERFFISTPQGTLVTCYTKCKADRDGWILALQLVLEKRTTLSAGPDDWKTSAEQQKIADALCEGLREWTTIVQEQAKDSMGIFKETRHWNRLGLKEKKAFTELEDYMNSPHVDVCSLVVGLYQYTKAPYLFVTTLAQLAVCVELNLEAVAMYWPQILHWGFAHLHTCQSLAMQLFYASFLSAVGRRSTVLAIKAHWECIAARVDAARIQDFDAYVSAALMQFSASLSSVEPDTATTAMVDAIFGSAEMTNVKDQAARTRTYQQLLDQLLHTSRSLLEQSRSCLFGEWLGAIDDVPIVSSKIDALCNGRYQFLHPFPRTILVETRRLSTENLRDMILPGEMDDDLIDLNEILADTSLDTPVAPPVHVFWDTVHLINSLIVASQNFKLQFTNGAERKAQLPSVLERLSRTLPKEAILPLSIEDEERRWVISIIEKEGTVFSTKARAPTMVYFETAALQVQRKRVCRSVDDEFYGLGGSFLLNAYLADMGVQTSISSPPPSGRSHSQSQPESTDPSLHADCPVAIKLLEENNNVLVSVVLNDDHSIVSKKESFAEKKQRLQEESSNSSVFGWDVVPVIAKSFDDMRQEVFVMQMMHLFVKCFQHLEEHIVLRPYAIMCCGEDCGLMEVLIDSSSISDVKKANPNMSLPDIFKLRYGEPNSVAYLEAQDNFIRSMAGYSLFCYVLQLKDRHNGNIMLHMDGSILHIDFGFAFGIAPGGHFSFERAPFKLMEEMVNVMGGMDSPGFALYKRLLCDGLIALSHSAPQIMALVGITSKSSAFPCFVGQNIPLLMRRLKERLCIGMTEADVRLTAQRLIDQSCNSLRTRLYDRYQLHSNGYAC
ncbi:phosphatidylinositol kinase (PIK-I) [Thraustotheca clavata]|uniref:1-phosphatidylinositol 4-kinase n=1 Tax=Thraustotheca clavata TaxID=74557 RepID=A0A1W0A6Z4_9STRA|nr:phosphatidylinositol kinase (PIK-I) [Thraustotheca clavata]